MVFRIVTLMLRPLLWWGRVEVVGLDNVPVAGPLIVVPNHDSQMDPVVVGVALRRRRPLRFLARAELWDIPGLGPLMSGMRQIPVRRGAGDSAAMDEAAATLAAGDAICVFPEGRLSRGEQLRARSGVGRLIRGCPDATVVPCAVQGATDYVRFPRRPRVTLTFLSPVPAAHLAGAEPAVIAGVLLATTRRVVPPTPAGRTAAAGTLEQVTA